jgi:hypothetical protein
MVQGMPLQDGSKAYKTVEVRGARCITPYRGTVAIFCSASYDSFVEDHYVWYGAWSEQADKRKAVSVKPKQDYRFRAWCQYAHAWKYRLIGFVTLHDVISGRGLKPARLKDLHRAATDFRGDWIDPESPNTYLKVSALHEAPDATGPKFDSVCYGCTVQQPHHNTTACHVNWQTVCIDEKYIPNHVAKEIGPWQPK